MATLISGVQYSGIWTMQQVDSAIAAGTWPVVGPKLYGWGGGYYGALGLGNTTLYSSPKQVGSVLTWSKLSANAYNSFGIKSDGTLWAWGWNQYGALGLGNTTNYSSPKQVGSLTNWSEVTSGYNCAYGVKSDGTLWSWGRNQYGQLGLGNVTYYSSPKQVGVLTNWLKITANYSNAFAVKTNGTLWSWGFNGYGQLGHGNTTYLSSPKQIGSLTTWASVGLGMSGNAAYAIKTDGTLWSWGANFAGQLGLSNSTAYNSPKQVGALTSWSSVTGINSSALALKTDGTLWSWGQNSSGVCGLGSTTYYSSPKQVGSLTNWLILAGGGYGNFAAAIKTDGTLWTWGANGSGMLGLNNRTEYSSPKQVGSLATWSAVTTGNAYMFGIAYTG